MEEIKQKIKAARKAAGKTQKELGEILGVSEAMVCQWETGARVPKQETIKKIADGLGITPFDLIGAEWFDIQSGPEKIKEIAEGVAALDMVQKAYGEPASELLAMFSELNETGQEKAYDYVSDLSEQPKYQKKE